MAGPAPLDLPANWTGRYSVVIEGAGCPTTSGVLYIPSTGTAPSALSDGPAMSGRLVLRSLNYPGLPDLGNGRAVRGIVLGMAATASAAAVVRSQIFYRHALADGDAAAMDRATEYKQDRNRWIGYTLSTWGLSAVGYWMAPRMGVGEATPQRVTLTAPELTRFAVAWRSLLVPGAGQDFADRHARGAFWMASVLAAGAAALIADHDVRHQQDLLSDAQASLAAADSTKKPPFAREVALRSDDLRTAKSYRRGFVGATVGFHVANFLDALILPLSQRPAAPRKVSAVTRFGPGLSELALRVQF
jgi:hypothetical protein